MRKEYYVNRNAQDNGDHEVHEKQCHWFPGNALYLGEYEFCYEAVQAAKNYYSKVNGCKYCSSSCHTR